MDRVGFGTENQSGSLFMTLLFKGSAYNTLIGKLQSVIISNDDTSLEISSASRRRYLKAIEMEKRHTTSKRKHTSMNLDSCT